MQLIFDANRCAIILTVTLISYDLTDLLHVILFNSFIIIIKIENLKQRHNSLCLKH